MTPRLPLRPKVKPMIHCYPSPRAAFSQTINSKRSSSSILSIFLFFCALSISWQIIGCDRPSSIVPVTGTVLLDGKPLEGAAVLFHPEADERPAVGITDNLGTFYLTTRTQGDGGRVGINRVSITKERNDPTKHDAEEESQNFTLVTPPQYASPDLSGLEINVSPGMDPIIFKLTSH